MASNNTSDRTLSCHLIRLENHIENTLKIRVRHKKDLYWNGGEKYGLVKASGISYKGRIALERELDLTEKLHTLFHELYHELFHSHTPKTPQQRNWTELEANTFASVVMHMLGIPVPTHHRDLNWILWKASQIENKDPLLLELLIRKHVAFFLLSLANILGYTNRHNGGNIPTQKLIVGESSEEKLAA